MRIKIISYGTKVVYHSKNGDVKCFCGHYNKSDDTYNIYNGWDLTHVPASEISGVE